MLTRSQVVEYLTCHVFAEKTRASHVRVIYGLMDYAELIGSDPLTTSTILAYLNTLKPHAKKRAHGVLSNFFSWRIQAGHDRSSPLALIPKPTALSPPRTGLTRGCIVAIMDTLEIWLRVKQGNRHFSAYRLRITLLLCLYYGLRVGQLADLNLKDFDRRTGVLQLRSKDKRRAITVALHEEVKEMLLAWLPVANSRRRPGEESLFVNWSGKRLQPVALSHQFDGLLAAAGIDYDRGGLHQMRHTMAGLMLEEGKSIQEVAKYLGHYSLSSTDYYCRQHFGTKNQTGYDLMRGILQAEREPEVDIIQLRPVKGVSHGEE